MALSAPHATCIVRMKTKRPAAKPSVARRLLAGLCKTLRLSRHSARKESKVCKRAASRMAGRTRGRGRGGRVSVEAAPPLPGSRTGRKPAGGAGRKVGTGKRNRIVKRPQYGAFTNTVSLACSNLPARTACRFSPSSVTPGSGGAASTLTLSTTAPTAVFNLPFGLPPAYGLWIGFLALCLLSLMVLQRPASRRLATLGLAAGLFVFILTLQVACGADSTTVRANPGTTAGTYTVTVTGTSGSLVNSVPVTLTVQ